MNAFRKSIAILSIAALAGWAVPSIAAAQELQLNAEQRENTIALAAKLIASAVFVAGRDAEEFIRNDLEGGREGMPNFDDVDVAIDFERKRVTLAMEGLPPRTAIYVGDQGCTLLPKGMDNVQFTPVPVRPNLPDPVTQDWPMGDRLPSDPLPPEVDAAALEAALDDAFDDALHNVPQKTRAMVVVYKDRIIAERYAPGFDMHSRHINWSMGKSITAALIGILVGEGHFTVDDPAPIAEWRRPGDPRGAIRIRDLLRMSSGLEFHTGSPADGSIYTSRDNHRYVYFAAPNVYEYSIQNPLEFPPNTVWRYRNCDPLSLGKIMKDVVTAKGEEFLTFPQRALFDPIGIRNMVLECDPHGNFIMTGFEYGTARDWARFGMLHLNGGVWQGKRILPEGWIDFITTPAPANQAQKNYGGQFWLNAGGSNASLPRDMYWAAGHHGQHVRIIPSRGMVIVRLGHSVLGGFDRYMETVTARILDAVDS